MMVEWRSLNLGWCRHKESTRWSKCRGVLGPWVEPDSSYSICPFHLAPVWSQTSKNCIVFVSGRSTRMEFASEEYRPKREAAGPVSASRETELTK